MSDRIKFKLLETELQAYLPVVSKAADTVLDEGVSKYPIFVAHQHTMDIGIQLIDHNAHKGNWSIHVSTLEEFVTKQLIQPDKVDNFKEVFKDPQEHICFFVLSELGATFIFIPRKPVNNN